MKQYFSFEGRIRRSDYLVTQIVANVGFWFILFATIAVGAAGGEIEGLSGLALFILMGSYIVYFWIMLAAGAKRCHDRGNSGFFQLIPFYGLWMLFADGEYGSNQYGPDPKNRVNLKEFQRQTA